MGDSLNGALGYVFAIAILDAAILSWIVLRAYRAAVTKLMGGRGAAPDAADAGDQPSAASVAGQPSPLAVVDAAASPPASGARGLPPGWRRIVAAYAVGALVHAGIMAGAAATELGTTVPAALVSMVWANTWPLLPALGLLLALSWTRMLTFACGFMVIGSAAVLVTTLGAQLWRGAFSSALLTNVLWANAYVVLLAWAPLLLLAIIGWRRIRAVVAMTLTGTILFGIALLCFQRALPDILEVAPLRALVIALAKATSAHVAYYAVYMLLAVPFGGLVWLALRWLAAAFERKAFSDIQLTVDCWIAIITLEGVAVHLVEPFGAAGIAIGLAAFAGYRLSVGVMLRLLPAPTPLTMANGPARLLLLRVFGYQSRTESLFDYIAQHWRFHGSVQLIAGRDLAMRIVDPGDLLAFVGGRLRDQYVTTIDEIPDRVRQIDLRRDPDGRFRINELYCLPETWQRALQSLLTITDAVVMDLRGFSETSRGCVFELQQLVQAIPAERIVLVADATTDLTALERVVQQARTRATASARSEQLTLINVQRGSRTELDVLMRRLLATC